MYKVLMVMMYVCIFLLMNVEYLAHLVMYRGEDKAEKAGYIPYVRLRKVIMDNLHRLMAQKPYKGSLWVEPTVEEAVQRNKEGKHWGFDLGEVFEWHAGQIHIENKYYWTDPITYYRVCLWVRHNWGRFLVREDGLTCVNKIEAYHAAILKERGGSK